MHCIVMSSPNAKEWALLQSVEIIRYKRAERRVNILFLLLANNTKPEGENELFLLHRGRTECRLLSPWPLPNHPDEAESPRSILSQLYGELFEDRGTGEGDNLFLRETNRAYQKWDEFMTGRMVIPYRIPDGNPVLHPAYDPTPDKKYIPFTKWRLGGFFNPGCYLVCFSLTFQGETYQRLVEDRIPFTVDGPERLISRIKYDDIAGIRAECQKKWLDELKPFTDYSTALGSHNYHVILLNQSPEDEVTVMEDYCTNGIYPGFDQPRPDAKVFITGDQAFTLPLAFLEMEEEKRRVPELNLG